MPLNRRDPLEASGPDIGEGNLLQYQPQQTWYRRKPVLRIVAGLAILIGVVALLPLFFDHLKLMSLVSLQTKCMSYVPAPGQPAATVTNARTGITQTSTVQPAWSSFVAGVSPPGLKSAGTVVLHKMQTPEGIERLVGVDVATLGVPVSQTGTTKPDSLAVQLDFGVKMFEPGTLMRPPREVQLTVFDRVSNEPMRFAKSLVVDQGTPDPGDSTHFTFRIHLDEQTRLIDGWITGDNTVVLEAAPRSQ